jgi:MFS family permease
VNNTESNLPPPSETAATVERNVFGVTDDKSRRRAIREALLGVVKCTFLIPLIFYLRFREIGPLGWGTTVFFDAYCLLTAIGLYFRPRKEYHSPVKLKGDWIDRIGAFWLVGCAFGPFFGWIVTTGAIPITLTSWRWLYGFRIFLSACIPILLALPLTRYIRGKSAWVALPLLVCVTLLPVSTAMNVSQDLWEGPVTRQNDSTGRSALYLKHTGWAL